MMIRRRIRSPAIFLAREIQILETAMATASPSASACASLAVQRSSPPHLSVSRCASTQNPSPSSSPSPAAAAAAARTRTLAAIDNSGVIACLRAKSGELAMEAARAAIDGGISVLEITMTTPDVLEVLQGLIKQYPKSVFGVGTVLDAMDAKSAIEAGAKFLMSPVTVKKILDDVQDSEVLYIPGVMTPTEVLTAYHAGARIVKVYPVSILGGAQYISALKKPFSHIPLLASQGITIDSIGTYIDQGASSVVLSDAIFEKEAMSQRNYEKIRKLARIAAIRSKEVKRKFRRLENFAVPSVNCSKEELRGVKGVVFIHSFVEVKWLIQPRDFVKPIHFPEGTCAA